MPADSGARRIFRHQHLLQPPWLHAGEGSRLLAQRQERRWDLLGWFKLVRAPVVAKAEEDYPAVTLQPADKFERLERQRRYILGEPVFLCGRDDLFGIGHPVREIRAFTKQAWLRRLHRWQTLLSPI